MFITFFLKHYVMRIVNWISGLQTFQIWPFLQKVLDTTDPNCVNEVISESPHLKLWMLLEWSSFVQELQTFSLFTLQIWIWYFGRDLASGSPHLKPSKTSFDWLFLGLSGPQWRVESWDALDFGRHLYDVKDSNPNPQGHKHQQDQVWQTQMSLLRKENQIFVFWKTNMNIVLWYLLSDTYRSGTAPSLTRLWSASWWQLMGHPWPLFP